jgi:hypothetical protein
MRTNKPAILTMAAMLIFALGPFILGLTGCKTAPDGTQTADIERIARVTKEAATIGTMEVLARRPDWRAHFQIAHVELLALEKSDKITLDSILNIVSRLPVKELRSDDARLAITGARLLISAIDVPEIDAERLAQLRPIVVALREGIESGGGGGEL